MQNEISMQFVFKQTAFKNAGIHLLNMYILKVTENPKYFKKPDNNNNHNNNVEDVFYLTVHWDIIIDKPKKDASNN
jgi:hypothetical protein